MLDITKLLNESREETNASRIAAMEADEDESAVNLGGVFIALVLLAVFGLPWICGLMVP